MTNLKIGLIDDTGTERVVDAIHTGDYLETTPGSSQSLPLNLSVDPNTSDIDRYRYLIDLIDASGGASVTLDRDGVAAYTETLRPNAEVNTLLVEVTPNGIAEMDGVWAVVTGGSDDTEIIGAQAILEIEITVLARHGEYADRTAVENNLKVSVP